MSLLPIDPSEIYLPNYKDIRSRLRGDAEMASRLAKAKKERDEAIEREAKLREELALLEQKEAAEASASDLSGAILALAKPSMLEIASAVALRYGLRYKDIKHTTPGPIYLAHIRYEAMYEIRKRRPEITLTAIGRVFDTDYSTVSYGCRQHCRRTGEPALHSTRRNQNSPKKESADV